MKSRFTVADVKSKNHDKQQQETFSPTPTTMAGAVFEVLTLEREYASVTMDAVP